MRGIAFEDHIGIAACRPPLLNQLARECGLLSVHVEGYADRVFQLGYCLACLWVYGLDHKAAVGGVAAPRAVLAKQAPGECVKYTGLSAGIAPLYGGAVCKVDHHFLYALEVLQGNVF